MSDFAELARRARLARLILEAQGKTRSESEHQRLKERLAEFAHLLGCGSRFDLAQATSHRFDPEPNPDVETSGDGVVFVGDAKDGANEPASRDDSRSRIFRYMMALASIVRSGRVANGYFVIATNSFEAARGWADALTLAAGFCGLVHVETQTPGFGITQLDAQTWIVW